MTFTCNICPTKCPSHGGQVLHSTFSGRCAEISSSWKPKVLWNFCSLIHCRASAIGMPYFCPRFSGSIWHAVPTFHRWSVDGNTWHLLCTYRQSVQCTDRGPWLLEVLGIPCALQLIQAHAGNASEIFTLFEQTEPLKSQREVTNFLTSNSLVEECACPQCTIATLTPIEDNWVCSHTHPKVSILCVNGHKALTISPLIMFCSQTFSQRCCKEHIRDKWVVRGQGVLSPHLLASHKLSKFRIRHSFSQVTLSKRYPNFWKGGTRLKKNKISLSYYLGNHKLMSIMSSCKALQGPIAKAKCCTESAPALGMYTFPGRKEVYRAAQYIWYPDISSSPALRFLCEPSNHTPPQL